MKSQDLKSQLETKFELSLSQMLVQPSQPTISIPLPTYLLNKAKSSCLLKKTFVKCCWYRNLDRNAYILMILLQVGCIELGT